MTKAFQRAERYIDTLPPSISGQQGHRALFRAACYSWNGFALSEDEAMAVLQNRFNPRCQPPWSERDIRYKIKSATKAKHTHPRGYLLSKETTATRRRNEANGFARRSATIEDCKQIARARNLSGPGLRAASILNLLKVGQWNGQTVYGIRSTNGPVVAIRRADGKPFPAYKDLEERKCHCMARGLDLKRPVGWIPQIESFHGIALFEGMTDYLAGWEKALEESTLEAQNGNPFSLGPPSNIIPKLPVLPLAMMGASLSIPEECIHWFANKTIWIFIHNDPAGTEAANRWAKQIHSVTKKVKLFHCRLLNGTKGADFNDCYPAAYDRIFT